LDDLPLEQIQADFAEIYSDWQGSGASDDQ